jgi:two-component sensor histidine kinase
MAVVFARWREELPYRFLWLGFVIFITACGLSHLMHAFHVIRARTPHTWPELAVIVVTAVVSLATAAAFTWILPRIMKLASPAQARRRMEEAVRQATGDLQKAVEHQHVLLLEVHHRVKNNLQVILSLVNLHRRRAGGSNAEGLKDLGERIAAIASAHGQLEEVGASRLKARPFVQKLAAHMESARGSGSGRVIVTGDDFEVPLDHATSFALIVHEALAHAFDPARPDAAPDVVRVHLTAAGRVHEVRIGTGAAPPAMQPADGIGMMLINALSVQLNATTRWEDGAEGGTDFVMAFAGQEVRERLAVT